MSTTNVKISGRAQRAGEKVSMKKFQEFINNKTKTNLATLADKFGIEWKNAVVATDAEGYYLHNFTVVGMVQGLKVYYDRSRLSIVIGKKREVVSKALAMTQEAFAEKMYA